LIRISSKYYSLLLLILYFSFNAVYSADAHKFYLSLTEIHIREDKKAVEISMRIFPDDLDRAIEMTRGVNPRILTKFEHDSADAWIMEYLARNFFVRINGKQIHCSFLGKEAESDAVWCYLEAPLPGTPDNIQVQNTLLTEIFQDQKNIIQVYYKEYNRGALLDRNRSTEKFIIKN
jgi:hypothetical protein